MDEFPEKEKKDHLHDATRIGLNLVPYVGGSLAAVFETVFSAPIDNRKKDWLIRLSEIVNELCKKVEDLTPEKLSNNPEFISICLQASNISVRTHHEEKLRALNNAVKNSVLIDSIDESKKMIFLRIIDNLTPIHFRVLNFLISPQEYIDDLNSRQPNHVTVNYSGLGRIWDKLNDDIKSDSSLVDLAITELKGWGLIHISKFHEAGLDIGSIGTTLGLEFVGFIKDET